VATGPDRHPGVTGRRPRPGRGTALAALAVVGCLGLAGCAGQEQSGSPAHQVATWVAGAGAGSSIGSVDADLRNVDVILQRHDPAGEVRSVCAILASDAANGNGNLPSPDQTLSLDLSKAYATAYDAGNDCYDGAGGNARQLAESATLRARAEAQMATAVARITSVTGKSPSTTTTTAPPGSNDDPFGN
jgi:hypothetical protein